MDIAALSETRLAGVSQFKEEKGGYVFFTCGKAPEEPRRSGVGFAVKSELANSFWFDDQDEEAQEHIGRMHQAHKVWIDDKNFTIKKKAYRTCKAKVQ